MTPIANTEQFIITIPIEDKQKFEHCVANRTWLSGNIDYIEHMQHCLVHFSPSTLHGFATRNDLRPNRNAFARIPLLALFLAYWFLSAFSGQSQNEFSLQDLTQEAQNGNAEAQYRLGKAHLLGDNIVPRSKTKAFKWLMKSSVHRYPPAEYLLGTMYFDGSTEVPGNREEGLKYFKRSAESGFAAAQNKIGEHYLHGWQVEKDLVQAANWFQKAAKQGLADAQFNLGQRYFKAEGVKQSDEIATKWLLKAANQGHHMAQFLLAQRYAEGGADRIDHVEAYKWATVANQQKIINGITKKMTPKQIQKAKSLAEQFEPILELDPLEPPPSNFIYWALGVSVTVLYGVAFYMFLRRRRNSATPSAAQYGTTI